MFQKINSVCTVVPKSGWYINDDKSRVWTLGWHGYPAQLDQLYSSLQVLPCSHSADIWFWPVFCDKSRKKKGQPSVCDFWETVKLFWKSIKEGSIPECVLMIACGAIGGLQVCQCILIVSQLIEQLTTNSAEFTWYLVRAREPNLLFLEPYLFQSRNKFLLWLI